MRIAVAAGLSAVCMVMVGGCVEKPPPDYAASAFSDDKPSKPILVPKEQVHPPVVGGDLIYQSTPAVWSEALYTARMVYSLDGGFVGQRDWRGGKQLSRPHLIVPLFIENTGRVPQAIPKFALLGRARRCLRVPRRRGRGRVS